VTEDQWDQRLLPEPTYPRRNIVQDFDTRAMRMEVAKHDRWILEGMMFMHYHLMQQQHQMIMSYAQNEFISRTRNATTPRLCISISVCNRRLPYIYTLLMSLIRQDLEKTTDPSNLLSMAQVNLLNIEKRPEEQVLFPNTLYEQTFAQYLNETLATLPFIHRTYDLTRHDPILDPILQERTLTYHEITISDHLMILRTCLESGAPWCLILEEDAIVSQDFMTSIQDFILDPLDKKKASFSFISLYSYYNLVFKGDQRLTDPSYSKFFYEEDRGMGSLYHGLWDSRMMKRTMVKNTTKDEGSSIRSTTTNPPSKRIYTVSKRDYKYGAVANLYTLESVRKLIVYLEEIIVDNPEHNADEFINAEEHFPLASGTPRKQVDPSLVNHIGFYSERMIDVKDRGMFSQLNTDVRFVY
jgi:hypothetical protein